MKARAEIRVVFKLKYLSQICYKFNIFGVFQYPQVKQNT